MKLGERVSALRQAHGWSLVVGALQANLSESKLQAIESGTALPTTAQLLRLARGLGVSAAYLEGQEDAVPEGLEGNSLYRLVREKLAACNPEHQQRILVMLLQGVQMVKKQGFSDDRAQA